MKRLAGLIALLVPLSAMADGEPDLWLTNSAYPDEYEMSGCCWEVSSPFLTLPVYLFAETIGTDVESVAGVEFRIDNLPGFAEGVLVTHTWHTLLVDGDPTVGVALAFDPPLAAGWHVALGRVDLFFFSTSLIGDDWRFGVAPSLASGELRLVDGVGVEHACTGYGFVLNGSDNLCYCSPYHASTAAKNSSWGQVKQLY